MENFIKEINQFRSLHGMTKYDFGKKAMNDVTFLYKLEAGRQCKWITVDRIQRWMQNYKENEQ